MAAISTANSCPGRYGQFLQAAFYAVITIILCMAGCSFRDSHPPSLDSPQGVTVNKGARGTKPYTIKGTTYYPLLSSHGFREEGIASWYGKDFHGKTTANGERYDMHGMTAAHKLLPFGTQVKVTNKENGRSVIVRVNDRGPFVANRVIDLTNNAAEQIGMIAKGTAPVTLETQGAVSGLKDGDMLGSFYVQIGAFANKSNADRMVMQLRDQGKAARSYFAEQVSLFRVQAGPFGSLNAAESASRAMLTEYPNNFVVAD